MEIHDSYQTMAVSYYQYNLNFTRRWSLPIHCPNSRVKAMSPIMDTICWVVITVRSLQDTSCLRQIMLSKSINLFFCIGTHYLTVKPVSLIKGYFVMAQSKSLSYLAPPTPSELTQSWCSRWTESYQTFGHGWSLGTNTQCNQLFHAFNLSSSAVMNHDFNLFNDSTIYVTTIRCKC